jgi:uncharacterized membrane protein
MSSHTGVPTVLGWANHEGLWRGNDAEVNERGARVRLFYGAADPRSAWDVIQKYGVTHVIVGDLERKTYPGAERVGNLPFLAPAAELAGTTIYTVARPQ